MSGTIYELGPDLYVNEEGIPVDRRGMEMSEDMYTEEELDLIDAFIDEMRGVSRGISRGRVSGSSAFGSISKRKQTSGRSTFGSSSRRKKRDVEEDECEVTARGRTKNRVSKNYRAAKSSTPIEFNPRTFLTTHVDNAIEYLKLVESVVDTGVEVSYDKFVRVDIPSDGDVKDAILLKLVNEITKPLNYTIASMKGLEELREIAKYNIPVSKAMVEVNKIIEEYKFDEKEIVARTSAAILIKAPHKEIVLKTFNKAIKEELTKNVGLQIGGLVKNLNAIGVSTVLVDGKVYSISDVITEL